MRIVEQAQAELASLPASEVLVVYDLIRRLKAQPPDKTRQTASKAYLRVRRALRKCGGNLSDDIQRGRDERA
ncbi:MAG: hypothetical protein A3K19_31585 [Lentisphaerae bacterium RIFOXYB12_FULL_65_16]|nr:MAG: hypothetical protein A3K18_03880 [Lentisphaerae bacterium RIFOXYA12_64_32]OGV88646.1 MAG: hypothetical protein A3K19_31585 [Lentisphaerae bacterium RIFOXYB12_FULL_65_16]